MRYTSLAPWYGAKRELAREIAAELGPHSAYWEPFCGSMSVLLAKPTCAMETACDLHGDIINLARTIQCPVEGPRLYRRLRRVWMCEELYREAARVILSAEFEPTPARAFYYFTYSWIGMSGVAGAASVGYHFARRFTKNGGSVAKKLAGAVDSIPAFRARLRSVNVLRGDGLELLERVEDADRVVIYCDPPYLVKSKQYAHDFTPEQHERLAELLRRFRRTRVVVSYYDDPRLDGLYPGWTKVSKTRTKNMARMARQPPSGAVVSPEVLLINGPSLAATVEIKNLNRSE